jgi:hypothetical protein
MYPDAFSLARLRLCGMPRVHCFAEDCRQIAEKFGVRVEMLEEACWSW